MLVVLGCLFFYWGRSNSVFVNSNTGPGSEDPSTGPDRQKLSTWLLFAIDTVIPVIHLDRRHDDIAFNGWLRWYLGFLRAMGAVLVFLVFYFLQQVLVGSE